MCAKYVITNSGGFYGHLGHELFFTRKIALILLVNQLIDKDYCIVTCNDDRKFLYTNIFSKVITYLDFIKFHESNPNKFVIDLRPYLSTVERNVINDLKKLSLPENLLINNNIFLNCNSSALNQLACNIEFIDLIGEESESFITRESRLTEVKYGVDIDTYASIQGPFSDIIKNNFIIIHIRSTSKYVNYLLSIIDKLNVSCIIFTQLNNIPKKYHQTSNLQVYASLLNNKNCLAILSEWSGGGQLSQFCCHGKILYYFDHYPESYFNDKELEYRNANDKNLCDAWDHYTPINSKRYFLTKTEFANMDAVLQHFNL